ncbi:hypothetical protein NE237_016045 [Protea cynaroides]|uniref:Uncharacterized protein n=1 Tax=Protea cynaroides TaxID=273540 RepID=A0A9Q0QRS7_9MAGN|nr:hypothetical protein NE237_016045 [Protea cynaroides]
MRIIFYGKVYCSAGDADAMPPRRTVGVVDHSVQQWNHSALVGGPMFLVMSMHTISHVGQGMSNELEEEEEGEIGAKQVVEGNLREEASFDANVLDQVVDA